MIWTLSRHSFRTQFLCLVSLVLFADTTFAGQAGALPPLVVEVFISDKHAIIGTDIAAPDSNSRQLAIVVYKINAIQSIERDLSANLPAELQQSKQIVLHRIQGLDEQTRSRMQAAAMGLAKAMQYGIDRYPAIVFDRQAVIYGVTDLKAALAYHQAWRAGAKP
ncbi:TIGR03757 family integrating conjugative element protein [Pseudomonadota bacterium]